MSSSLRKRIRLRYALTEGSAWRRCQPLLGALPIDEEPDPLGGEELLLLSQRL